MNYGSIGNFEPTYYYSPDDSIYKWIFKSSDKKENKQMQNSEVITFNKSKSMLKNLGVKKVVFNNPVVVVELQDGRKGVAKCGGDDQFDEEVGFALAYTLAKTGSNKVVNKSNYKKHIDNLSFRNKKNKKNSAVIVEV